MADRDIPELEITLDKVCWLILRTNEFDAKDVAADEDSGSNPSDDNMADVLEDHGDDPVVDEIKGVIEGMSDDERIELVTLMWLGRDDDATVEDWDELRAEAARMRNRDTAGYLLGTPLVGSHLESGLAKLDLSCSGIVE